MGSQSDPEKSQLNGTLGSEKDSDSGSISSGTQKTNISLNRNKPVVSDANDEAELGKMMGDDGEKLLALVDDIRKIDSLRNEELHIPQIVVIGDTSTGKSSVLQALTRLPFPVAGDLCTRFVTETTIRRCGPSEIPGYTIEVKMDDPTQEAPFPPKVYESGEWVDVFQKLRGDIDDAFGEMSPEHLPAPGKPKRGDQANQRVGSTSSRQTPIPQLLRHRLQITVRKPDQAHFSIVDVPGLVSSGAAVDIQLSVELARQYIKNEEAIVLAITPANNVIVNEKWLNLVTEEHAIDRTIGVITKPDRIEEANHQRTFDLLKNRAGSEHCLRLGWFAVRNRSTQEILEGESFEERDRKEEAFFASGKWQDATSGFPSWSSIDPRLLGIRHLKRSLQTLLYKRVKENFPRLRSKMRDLETEYATRLRGMGEPRDKPRDQRVYLSAIQGKYEAEVERSLNGDYRFVDTADHPSRLRYHVKGFNDTFDAALKSDAVKYSWQEGDADAGKGGIFAWISTTWDNHRGSEPRHDAPRSLKKALVREQTESWEAKAVFYIEQVETAIKACNDDLFRFACEDAALRSKIREKLQLQEEQAFQAARNELQAILSDRDYIDSWNPQLALFIYEHQHPRMGRQVELQHEQDAIARGDGGGGGGGVAVDQVALRQSFYDYNTKVFSVHDWLFAYWKVAYPRFVDNVIIQVAERHLLGARG
ncbi:Dynamin-1-like protein, partial [Lachnellula suecica]